MFKLVFQAKLLEFEGACSDGAVGLHPLNFCQSKLMCADPPFS